MATYVGGTSNVGTGASYTVSLNGTLTGGSNSSPSAGDLILVFTGEANAASVTSTCSGNNGGSYSTIRAHQNAADTHDANLDSFYKFAGATPDTTLTITRGSNNTTYGSGTVVHVWRGIDPTTPFNVTPKVASGTNGSAANPPAITPTIPGSIVLYVGHASQVAASGTAFTTAGTYPKSVKGDGSTGDSIIMASHYTAWTSGAYDPAAFTGSTTTTALAWVGLTIVLAPKFYSLTCNSGSYTYTGSSANITYVGKRPILISTTVWQQDTLGTSGTPGAKAITVPSDAQAVVVQAHTGYGGTALTLSITSDFAGTFTVVNSGEQNNCSVGYALVTSTGSKNLTLAWSQSLLEGPTVYISFIKNINTSDWVREVAAIGTSASGSSASNVFDTSADDLLLVVNDNDSATPTTISGFTSIATTGTTYSLPSRLQSCDSPGATTTTVTGTSTNFDVLSGISIKPNITGAYTLTANAGSYTYTGSSATISRNRALSASAGSYTYTGSSAVITKGAALNHRSLTASAGSYSYTGSTATLVRGRSLTASAGSYSYSGQSATIKRNRSLTASSRSYSYTGQSATLVRGRSLSASAGSYTYSGQSAALSRGRKLTAQAGSYALTGSSAVITKSAAVNNYSITALAGSYTYTGSTATLLLGRSLTASAGSYAYSGQPISANIGRSLIANSGSYLYTGQAASIIRGRVLEAIAGSYTYTGSSAELLHETPGYSLICEPGAYVITGSSATITGIVTNLSEASILAIAQAVWERGLPLTSEPVVTYGTTELTQRDLNAISHAVWSRTL